MTIGHDVSGHIAGCYDVSGHCEMVDSRVEALPGFWTTVNDIVVASDGTRVEMETRFRVPHVRARER